MAVLIFVKIAAVEMSSAERARLERCAHRLYPQVTVAVIPKAQIQ